MKIRVSGNSMLPALADGDEVEVRLAEGREARVGDVVLVLQGSTMVLHRVVSRSEHALRTHGDALTNPDAPVPLERVLGIAGVPRRHAYARARALLGMGRRRASQALRGTLLGTLWKWMRGAPKPQPSIRSQPRPELE